MAEEPGPGVAVSAEKEAEALANAALRKQVDDLEALFRKTTGAVLVFNPVRQQWRLRVASTRQTLDVNGSTFLDAMGQAGTVLSLEPDGVDSIPPGP